MPNETFGTYLKSLRLAKGVGLSTFADKIGIFPSNLSDIERSKKPAPRDPTRLAQIASALGIDRNSPEWDKLHDLAVADMPERIPPDIVQYAKDNPRAVPLLLRTAARRKLSREEISALIERIKKSF